jgi:hypothetical protein
MLLNQDPLSEYFNHEQFITDYYDQIWDYASYFIDKLKGKDKEITDDIIDQAGILSAAVLILEIEPCMGFAIDPEIVERDEFFEFAGTIVYTIHMRRMTDLGVIKFDKYKIAANVSDKGLSLCADLSR